MTARDVQRNELAQIIQDTYDAAYGVTPDRSPGGKERRTADAILAAGFSRPRIVSTVEDLEALPVGSVVMETQTEFGIAVLQKSISTGLWYLPGSTVPVRGYEPFIVLFEPTEKETR